MTAQNIQFRGIRHTPSDITGQDGDLLDCVNLVHENGELKPIAMPERSGINVPTRDNRPYILTHIHNTTDGEMFVFVWKQDNGDDMLVVQDANNNLMLSKVDKNSIGQSVKWVESVGNTLVIGTDKSIHYASYKNGEYKWLGDCLPRPNLHVSLVRNTNTHPLLHVDEPHPVTLTRGEVKTDYLNLWHPNSAGWNSSSNPNDFPKQEWWYSKDTDDFSKIGLKDNLKAKIADIIHQAKHNNTFIFPFFVRYALKLYDGSYVCHSQPILMRPSTTKTPIWAAIYYDDYDNDGGVWLEANVEMYAVQHRLKYSRLDFVDYNNNIVSDADVELWSDIIKSVDVFISSPIEQIDYNRVENAKDSLYSSSFKGYEFPGSVEQGEAQSDNWLGSCYDMIHKEYLRNTILNSGETPSVLGSEHRVLLSYITIPSKMDESVLRDISSVGQFYLAKSYELRDFLNTIGIQNFDEIVDKGVLESLESNKTLPDDYISRSRITTEMCHAYNKRLVLGDIKVELPLWYRIFDTPIPNVTRIFEFYFVIEKQDGIFYIKSGPDSVYKNGFGSYIYYPDPDCKKVIVKAADDYRYYEIPMKEHENLNGSYAIIQDLEALSPAIDNGLFGRVQAAPPQSINRYYSLHNTIALAEVSNPFVMQAENFREVGNGRVIDLAPNTMEVSSGQWGQYPLYVFTTDGIYAFGINQDGSFGAMSPVSSDVLLHPKGLGEPTLIQTNQTLVFLTSRGVMGLSGTKVDSLSQVLDGRHFNVKNELGQEVIYDNGAFRSLMNEALPLISFHDFIKDGFLAYDYKHNKVVVLNNDCKYQYVLSLDNGLWGRQVIYYNLEAVQMSNAMVQQTGQRGSGNLVIRAIGVVRMSAAINNYTEMYLQGSDNKLYKTNNVSEENVENSLYQYGYFVTRPLRFGTDELKTITRLLHRYTHYAGNSFARLAMYGSRDGVRYARLNTLRGMSWRYYIFVVYTYLKPNERYSYMAADFEPRLTNKLR